MDCKLRAKNCGGCPMLGMDYAAQLKQKEDAVKKLLGKFGPVNAIRGAENPYHYRNKVISTFTTGWGGKLTSGIYAANSHKVLPVESCLLQDEVLDKTMLAVRAAANACHYQPYDENKGTGLLRHCLLRRGVVTGQVMVVLVTAQPVLPGAKNFVKALLAEAKKQDVTITTVVQNVNPRKTSVVLGDMEKVLYGKGFILDELCGKTYALSPRSFYQINHAQTEVLYGLAVEAAHLTGKEVVLDAYCGIGTIGLTAADHAKQVVGVEVNRDAVHDAIGNAKHNGVKNARFFAADATKWISEAAAAGERADVIFMDPPREGSTPEFIDSVARMAPKRVVYVSCNPVTLARDLELLTRKELDHRLARIRDVFVFCCLTGLAFADADHLRREHLSQDDEGRWWIHKPREKTSVMSRIPLLPASLEILRRYERDEACLARGRVLPTPSNQKMNAYMKEIAAVCGIDKVLTTHCARHTFACMAVEYGMPIDVLAKILGHSNTNMTRHYAKFSETVIGREMEAFGERLASAT